MRVAWWLRGVTLCVVGLAALWAGVWFARGRPLLAVGGALGIAFFHALVIGLELLLMGRANRHEAVPRATLAQRLRAWLAETWLDVVVFAWRQPFRSRRHADLCAPSGQRGVVLVHGFFCNRGLWGPLLGRLTEQKLPFVALDLPGPFGAIESGVPAIEAAVRRLQAATGLAPVLLAHSMGGLAVRAWLDRFAGDARVHRVITVGTPHRGTWLARFAPGRNTRQMRLGGPWVAALAAREPAARAALFTCFYSHCDNVVFPATAATLVGADNRHLAGSAHVQMLERPEVLAELLHWLASEGIAPQPAVSMKRQLNGR